MLGPIVLALVMGIGGALLGGAPGVVAGALVWVGVVASVAAGCAVWALRIGILLEPADAWEVAPCPPGFGRICRPVYQRYLPQDGEEGPSATNP